MINPSLIEPEVMAAVDTFTGYLIILGYIAMGGILALGCICIGFCLLIHKNMKDDD